MKKWAVILAIIWLTPVGGSMAQLDPDPDSIGIYFDSTGYQHNITELEPGIYGPGFMYLLITNASETSGISRWYCRLEYPPSLGILDWGFQGDYFNVASAPEFVIEQAAPLPWQPAIVLLEMTIFVPDSNCHWWFIHPVDSAPNVYQPSYETIANLENPIPLWQSTGDRYLPVAGINCDCPPAVDVRNLSWGSIKSIYR